MSGGDSIPRGDSIHSYTSPSTFEVFGPGVHFRGVHFFRDSSSFRCLDQPGKLLKISRAHCSVFTCIYVYTSTCVSLVTPVLKTTEESGTRAAITTPQYVFEEAVNEPSLSHNYVSPAKIYHNLNHLSSQ